MGARTWLRVALCVIALAATQGPVTAISPRPATALPLAAATSLTEIWSYENHDKQGSELGAAVSSAGDVNADGWADVLVGAPKAAGAVDNEGLVYFFLSSAADPAEDPTVVLSAGLAEAQGSRFGDAVASAGDIDADGYDDVIVGAPLFKQKDVQKPDAGAVFSFHGSNRTEGLTSHPDWGFYGDRRDAYLGAAVAGAGDVNGDGYADVVVGAPGYDNRGAVLVFLGSSSGLVTETITVITSTVASQFGAAVSGAGDVNGDGYDDIIVGAPTFERDPDHTDEGAAFIFLGSRSGIDTTADWQVWGDQPGARLGASVTGLGNANQDGYDDIAIGAPGYDADESDETKNSNGCVAVFYGTATGVGGVPDRLLEGPAPLARLGASLSGGGDINRDGFADLVIGMPSIVTDSGGSSVDAPEAALIYLGSETGLMAYAAWRVQAPQQTTDYGYAVSIVDHPQGDVYDGVLVGAPHYQYDTNPYGKAFAYSGADYIGLTNFVFLPLVLRAAP